MIISPDTIDLPEAFPCWPMLARDRGIPGTTVYVWVADTDPDDPLPWLLRPETLLRLRGGTECHAYGDREAREYPTRSAAFLALAEALAE